MDQGVTLGEFFPEAEGLLPLLGVTWGEGLALMTGEFWGESSRLGLGEMLAGDDPFALAGGAGGGMSAFAASLRMPAMRLLWTGSCW
jgi:hypothetical protein